MKNTYFLAFVRRVLLEQFEEPSASSLYDRVIANGGNKREFVEYAMKRTRLLHQQHWNDLWDKWEQNPVFVSYWKFPESVAGHYIDFNERLILRSIVDDYMAMYDAYSSKGYRRTDW